MRRKREAVGEYWGMLGQRELYLEHPKFLSSVQVGLPSWQNGLLHTTLAYGK